MTYEPDFRQKIADSWPKSIDGSVAKRDWDYSPVYQSVDSVTKEIMYALTRSKTTATHVDTTKVQTSTK